MSIYDLTDEFERQFPGLFENICYVSYGDITDDRITASLETRDQYGLDREGTADVILADIGVMIWVSFRDGISAGSWIKDYEVLPLEETEEGLARFQAYEKNSQFPYGDPTAIYIAEVPEVLWKNSEIIIEESV